MTPAGRVETQLPGSGPHVPASPVARGGGDDNGAGVFGDTRLVGLLAFLGSLTMLFAGFTSAYILRRTAADWVPLQAPRLLWVNTALLLCSSVTLELARRALRAWDTAGTRRGFVATGVLGLGFVVGQLGAWRQLAAAGVFLASHPHSSFFYVLTGVHALHVLGGLGWYVALAFVLRAGRLTRGSNSLGLFALYWHFLAALWLYLLVLLFAY